MTSAVRSARHASSRTARASSLSASTAEASSAALTAPASPIASVPTGTPAGIWTMERRLSMPDSAFDVTGTPNTGSDVIAAAMPGKCAAPPAPAMTTLKPAAFAPLAITPLLMIGGVFLCFEGFEKVHQMLASHDPHANVSHAESTP